MMVVWRVKRANGRAFEFATEDSRGAIVVARSMYFSRCGE